MIALFFVLEAGVLLLLASTLLHWLPVLPASLAVFATQAAASAALIAVMLGDDA